MKENKEEAQEQHIYIHCRTLLSEKQSVILQGTCHLQHNILLHGIDAIKENKRPCVAEKQRSKPQPQTRLGSIVEQHQNQ